MGTKAVFGSQLLLTDVKVLTRDFKEELTHFCVCSWQMFRMAASNGLLVIQRSDTNAKSHFLCSLRAAVAVHNMQPEHFFHTCLMLDKVWSLLKSHQTKTANRKNTNGSNLYIFGREKWNFHVAVLSSLCLYSRSAFKSWRSGIGIAKRHLSWRLEDNACGCVVFGRLISQTFGKGKEARIWIQRDTFFQRNRVKLQEEFYSNCRGSGVFQRSVQYYTRIIQQLCGKCIDAPCDLGLFIHSVQVNEI